MLFSVVSPEVGAASLPLRVADHLGQKCSHLPHAGRVPARGNAELPDKATSQMALIAKAGRYCHLRQCAAAPNEPTRQLDSPLNDVGVRRQAKITRERAQQLVAAEANFVREFD